MPRYELSEGTSNKFWEIKLSGTSFTTTYGRIGTAGQTTIKELKSAAEAKKEHDKLIAEKVKKGYVLAAGGAASTEKVKKGQVAKAGGGAAAADKRNPDLEDAIEADPFDVSAYMVYADWLQGQGDPRGELISLQLTAETKRDARLAKTAAALLDKHAGIFLGPLAEHTRTYDGNDRDAFTWRFGFIHAAKLSHSRYTNEDFKGSMAEVLEALLRHPSGRFVTELVFGFNSDPNDDPLDDLIAILARKAPATLRKLHFGDFEYPDETEMSWYHVGSLGKLWKAVPNLSHLIVQGGEFELGTIDLPALTRAEFRTGGLSAASARAIAKATWPRLEHLEVWYGDDNYGGTATLADAEALLARGDLPRLTSLGLRNTAFTDELCGVLATGRVIPQLTRLDLSMGIMTDEGAAALAAHKAAFTHLAVLDVSNNYLTRAGLASLKGLARSVVSTEQRDDDDPDYRHPSVGE
jgi:uncharacterized protein (TIGR02996 family)